MSNIEWKQAEVNGLKIKYFESGDSSGQPLVLIPGWPVASCAFKPLAEKMGDKLRCFAVNLPGFGGSQFCSGKVCGFDYHADFLEKFREEVVKTERINLFGYSTGGVVAINYASHYPKSVDKLIVFSPPYDGIAYWSETVQKSSGANKFYDFVHRNHWLVPVFNFSLTKNVLARLVLREIYTTGKYPKLSRLPRAYINRFVTETSQFDARAAIEIGEDLITRDFSEEAVGIFVRTLVLAASKDESVPPSWSSKLAQNILPQGKYIEIPEADHSAVVTEPERITPLVLDFLLS